MIYQTGGAGGPRDIVRSPVAFTDFLSTALTANPPWNIAAISSGTFTLSSGNVIARNRPGVARCTSSTTANSGVRCTTDVGQILLGGSEVFVAGLQILTLATVTLRIGFLDTQTSVDTTDGVYFEFNGTNIVGKTSQNSTRSTTGTSFTPVISTWYTFKVELNSNATLATFTILNADGTSVLFSATLATNIPTAVGRETGQGFVVTSSGTVAISLAQFDYIGQYYTSSLVRG